MVTRELRQRLDEGDRDKDRQAIAKAAEIQKEKRKAAEAEAAKAKEKEKGVHGSPTAAASSQASNASTGASNAPAEQRTLPAVLGGVAVGMGVTVRDLRYVSRATKLLRERCSEDLCMSPGEWWEESLLAPCNDGLTVSIVFFCVWQHMCLYLWLYVRVLFCWLDGLCYCICLCSCACVRACIFW